MPESKGRRRKTKRGRNIRQRMAQLDGEQVAAPGGCCPGLEVELAVGRVNARHDDQCPALNPEAAGHIPARVKANRAVGYVLQERGLGRPPTVMIR